MYMLLTLLIAVVSFIIGIRLGSSTAWELGYYTALKDMESILLKAKESADEKTGS